MSCTDRFTSLGKTHSAIIQDTHKNKEYCYRSSVSTFNPTLMVVYLSGNNKDLIAGAASLGYQTHDEW